MRKNKIFIILLLICAQSLWGQSLFTEVSRKDRVFSVLHDDLGLKGITDFAADVLGKAVPGGSLELYKDGQLLAKNRNDKLKYVVDWVLDGTSLQFTQYGNKNRDDVDLIVTAELVEDGRTLWQNIYRSKVLSNIQQALDESLELEIYQINGCEGKLCSMLGEDAIWLVARNTQYIYFSSFWTNPNTGLLRISHTQTQL